jgi:hypothetical protein
MPPALGSALAHMSAAATDPVAAQATIALQHGHAVIE